MIFNSFLTEKNIDIWSAQMASSQPNQQQQQQQQQNQQLQQHLNQLAANTIAQQQQQHLITPKGSRSNQFNNLNKNMPNAYASLPAPPALAQGNSNLNPFSAFLSTGNDLFANSVASNSDLFLQQRLRQENFMLAEFFKNNLNQATNQLQIAQMMQKLAQISQATSNNTQQQHLLNVSHQLFGENQSSLKMKNEEIVSQLSNSKQAKSQNSPTSSTSSFSS